MPDVAATNARAHGSSLSRAAGLARSGGDCERRAVGGTVRSSCNHEGVLPGAKASSLVTLPIAGGDPYAALERALLRHLVGCLGGDQDRDLDGLSIYLDATGCLYTGTWKGHPRLNIGLAVDPNGVADVLLVATKGTVRADDSLFGRSGPSVGNSLLVGRLLHVATFALRSAGILAIRNDPYDLRVQRIYEDMGFQNGKLLVLDDQPSLTKMFEYVAQTYQHAAASGRLSLADPPLPL